MSDQKYQAKSIRNFLFSKERKATKMRKAVQKLTGFRISLKKEARLNHWMNSVINTAMSAKI